MQHMRKENTSNMRMDAEHPIDHPEHQALTSMTEISF